MPKKEATTDLWVYDLLKEANIHLDPQGSSIKEIDQALKTASKSGKGNVGFPEYCGVVGDFLLVIEDKASLANHIYRNDKDLIDLDPKYTRAYAVNGAYHYALHLAANTSYHRVFAFGVSGDEKHHRITPLFVNERGDKTELPDVETFISFSEQNIIEYYHRNVLHEETDTEKATAEVIRDARTLHEDLRTYGSIKDQDKPLIVSGIMLALREIEHKNFAIDNLNGDSLHTDGEKIYNAIESNLKRANVTPDTKRDKILSQFAVIKDTAKINEPEPSLQKTPLRHYTEFLYNHIFKSVKFHQSAEDYIGLFYGEFMSYSGGDGQSLGIVLTPKHITTLFCDLLALKPTDRVLDPCCGTGGFLIAAMHHMLQQATSDAQRRSIRRDQLFGFELQPYMFTIATTNMILRGDGKSNLNPWDFLKQNPAELQQKQCTVGMMNPPYSQGTKADPSQYEINFTEHLLNSMVEGGRVAVIVPQSSFTGKTREEQAIKQSILKHHTLEGVITLNKETFYRVGTNPCIAVFTAGIPHSKDHVCRFINFEDDGFEVSKHIGLVETPSARDKRQHLLDVWRGAEAPSRFCVRTTIEPDDEWLHAFYYFNDEIPTEADFERTMADYLTFEFNMLTHGRGYLFEKGDEQ
ncbi:MAG: SAM-dependent DNA methyltransferase [Bacteroidales bacterium]|nr:SAM-dependent DNA methyltransferase [Bacteroidales bacterium]